jgi:hypothetical protein
MEPTKEITVDDKRLRCSVCGKLVVECNCPLDPTADFCPKTREGRHGWLPGSVDRPKNGKKKLVPVKICGACHFYAEISLFAFKQLFRQDFWRVVKAQADAEAADKKVAEIARDVHFTTEVTDGHTARKPQ